jgi:hypothetical protein
MRYRAAEDAAIVGSAAALAGDHEHHASAIGLRLGEEKLEDVVTAGFRRDLLEGFPATGPSRSVPAR